MIALTLMQSNQAAVTSVVIRRNDDVLFVQAFDDDVCLCIVSAAHCKSVSLLCHALGKLSETLVLMGAPTGLHSIASCSNTLSVSFQRSAGGAQP